MNKSPRFFNMLFCLFLFFNAAPIDRNLNPISIVNALEDKVHIYGTITDEQGKPLSKVELLFYDETWTTPLGNTRSDIAGEYAIDIIRQTKIQAFAQKGGFNQEKYVNLYIPISQQISTGNLDEFKQDFILQPSGNLIIYTYDEKRNVIRTGALIQVAEDKMFATDLTMMPFGYNFRPVYDNYAQNSGWDNNLALPAFSIPLNTPIAIHLMWTIPDFGKVIVNADNEGKGYVIDTQGDYYIIKNFAYEAAVSEYARLQEKQKQFLAQGYSLSTDVSNEIQESTDRIETVRTTYANSNPDKPEVTKAANLALKSILTAQEDMALLKATQSINESRYGYLQICVVDENGKPLEGAEVTFEQKSHDFLFGADPMGPNGDYDPTYATLLKDAGINYSYIRFGWGDVEPTPGNFEWGIIDDYQNISAQESYDFKSMGGLALWFSRAVRVEFSPVYQEQMTFSELKTNVYEHMRQIADRYKDQITVWELNEQNADWANVLNLTWKQKFEIIETAISGLKTGNPEAKVIFDANALPYEFGFGYLVSEDDVAGGVSPYVFLNELSAHNINYDYIGLEFYYAGAATDGTSQPPLTMASLDDLLDLYSSFGKPIFLRELSAPSTQQPNSTWWHRPWDEATQAEYLRDIYTIAFSKPLVQEIGWSYGVSDLDLGPVISGGILDRNLKPKASYFELKDLLTNQWVTKVVEKTGSDGVVDVQGFAGEYSITVTMENGVRATTSLHITEQQHNNANITLSTPIQVTPTALNISTNTSPLQAVPWWSYLLLAIVLILIGYLLFSQYHKRS